MQNRLKIFSLIMIAALSLAGCSNAKDKLGLTKKSPDEFAVVKRAPLSMPPNYTLRPPSPGAPRPQEQSPQEQAKQTVFGSPAEGAQQEQIDSGPDSTFLSKAGAINSDPAIRQRVDTETSALNEKEMPVIKRVLGMDGQANAPASVVNPKEEAERLKKNQQQGKPVTDGKTPSVER